MQHKIDMFGFAAHFFEKSFDLLITGNVAGKERCFFSKLADELLDIFFQSLALIIKNQSRAGRGPRLRNRPGDAALVRHAKDYAGFSGQNLLGHNRKTIRRINSPQSYCSGGLLVSP